MYNGDCYPNGSYFRDGAISVGNPKFNYLYCVLPGSPLSGGEWSRSNGSTVNCTSITDSDPLSCIIDDTHANITLYKPDGPALSEFDDQLYKCCLPTSCSDPTTNIITAYIFSKLSHCTSRYC